MPLLHEEDYCYSTKKILTFRQKSPLIVHSSP